MPAFALLFAVAALTVKQDGAELREGCEAGEPVITKLAAGTAATVRFGMNGCYAVDIVQSGAIVKGFLSAEAIEGIEAWEIARRAAPSVDTPANAGAQKSTATSPWELLRDNRPGEALAVAERALVHTPRDPQLLALAGLAAYKNDMCPRAIGYFKDAVAIRPDPAVQRLLDQAVREQGADRTGEPLHSPRFVFRYDPVVMPRETARAVLGVLEQEFSRISFELARATAERLAVIGQTREDYMRATGDPAVTRRALAHELVHACLAGIDSWPAWLHEGLAQKLSGESLAEPRKAAIRAVAAQNGLPNLKNLSQSWSRMSSGHAAMAYATSLYAVELYYQHHAAFGIRNLLRNPDQLERIMTDLDRRLRE